MFSSKISLVHNMLLVVASLAAFGLAQASGTGEATVFEPELGVCGHINNAQDFVVRVSADVFDTFPGATANPKDNPICNKQLDATSEGKSVTVTITDRCEGCPPTGIDLSPVAFNELSEPSVGKLSGVAWTIF
ncbi:unnamed protein product [Somion occarium]|uniref:RlpA-like protein double-psi beta-barrel domain-containing protein n=1 Tax=Somion occarium TaxID=3059160 RepID=A0ABP1DLH3_9APHY